MRKGFSKYLAMFLSATMLLATFAGCVKTTDSPEESAAPEVVTEEGTDAETEAEIEKATSGSITVYTAFEDDQIEKYLASFKEMYPDIEVEVIRESTGTLIAKVIAEKDNPVADVIWGTSASVMLQLEPYDLIKGYRPESCDLLDPMFYDSANEEPLWTGCDVYETAFLVNTKVCEDAGVPIPTSFADLLNPCYEGMIVMPDPTSSGTGMLTVNGILQIMGEEAGWEYIVVDIQWYATDAGTMRDKYQYVPFGDHEMDEFGRLLPDVNRFPSSAGGKGLGPLADYVHSLGLKFGIHIMRGIPRMAAHRHLPVPGTAVTANEIADPSSICGWNPDMYGVRKGVKGAQEYYDSIIGMYAEWGVDFIKCDDICNTNLYVQNPYSAAHEIEMLHHAIEKTGREIVLSLSPGPALIEKAWHYEKYANMWRITDDFWDRWDLLRNMFDRCELWQNHVSEGSYPDCDMLPLDRLSKNGNCHGSQDRMTQFTKPEQITMMSLWGIFKSPLMMGGNLPDNDEWTLSLLTNDEYMKMHRESFGAHQHKRNERNKKGEIIWVSNGKGCKYVALFNTDDKPRAVKLDLTEILMPNTKYSFFDIWKKENIGEYKNSFKTTVEPHGAVLLKIS